LPLWINKARPRTIRDFDACAKQYVCVSQDVHFGLHLPSAAMSIKDNYADKTTVSPVERLAISD
jgi:hypothetical protein